MAVLSQLEAELVILEAAVNSAGECHLDALLERLSFPLSYEEPLRRVLRRGRWRDSCKPMESVRRATLRAALRCESTSPPRESPGFSVENLGYLRERSDSQAFIKEPDRVWRQGRGAHRNFMGKILRTVAQQ